MWGGSVDDFEEKKYCRHNFVKKKRKSKLYKKENLSDE